MIDTSYDVLIVGAGYAGLCLSYFLKLKGISHLVLEKSGIGSAWKQQRWFTMKLNTPNKLNVLPGYEDYFADPEGFSYAVEYEDYLKSYTIRYALPVKEQCEVAQITKNAEKRFFVSCRCEGQEVRFYSKHIVVASGAQNQPQLPAIADVIDKKITRMHVSAYRNADALPDGAVLVVGSGQSGAQVADDLLDHGRTVYLSTSKVGHIPRRYRGKDIEDWLIITGYYETSTAKMSNEDLQDMKQPLISGVGKKGKTLTLLSLSKKGATLLGKARKANGKCIYFERNTNANIRFGFEFSARIKASVDAFITAKGMRIAPDSDAPEEAERDATSWVPEIDMLDLGGKDVNTVIYATGYGYNFNYLKFPIFTSDHRLRERTGPKDVKGLHFLNIPNQFKLKSGIILGITEDAKNLADKLEASVLLR